MFGEVVAEPTRIGGIRAGRAVPLADDEGRRAGAGPDKADHSRYQHDLSGNGTWLKKIAMKASAANAIIAPLFNARLPTR